MSEIHDECGVAAIYHLPGSEVSPLCGECHPWEVSRLLPRMLLDIQNRGQLAAGMTTYDPSRDQLIDTHKDVGSVSEVFRLSHLGKREALMQEYAGLAAIGHVRYATCGRDDKSYAQPFERHHLRKHKWFSFAFNGQLANYTALRDHLLEDGDHHLARETDTEIIMHEISRELSVDTKPKLVEVMRNISSRFDGAYSLVFLNACGDMMVARDPLGIKPLCYAKEGPLFAAASESVALAEPGFSAGEHSLVAAWPDDLDRRWRVQASRRSHPRRAGLIASSSGSTSPTWPARWTIAACTCPARRWASNWRGSRKQTGACRWRMDRRSWFPCPTPAKPPRTRWRLNLVFPPAKA